MAKKTISGARTKRGQRSNGCNPRHNNRDYIPSNADPNRQDLNVFYAESTRAITIEQIYEKLFQASYEEWLAKEHAKGRQMDAPELYIDKIRQAGESRNAKREQYEIIWQIGDMHNTGWLTNREDFMAARRLLQAFAEHLQTLPEIEVVTPEKLADPNWQPKSDCCLIVTNLALHGDEHTPQIHMDFIPYCRGAKRGQKIQNAYAAAFEGMGYAVKTEELKDENGNTVFKTDKDGKVVFKQNKDGSVMIDESTGAPIPDPVIRKVSFGSIDWIENQKTWLAERMKAERGWDREYKGKNKFGDVTISRFEVEDNKRIIAEQESKIAKLRGRIDAQERMLAENDEWMNEQAKLLDAYESRAEYIGDGQKVQQLLTDIQEDLDNLPPAPQPKRGLFRGKKQEEPEEDPFRAAVITHMQRAMGIARDLTAKMNIFEQEEPDLADEQLSEPAKQRANTLDERIGRAMTKSERQKQITEYFDAYRDYRAVIDRAWDQANDTVHQQNQAKRDAERTLRRVDYVLDNYLGPLTLGFGLVVRGIVKLNLKAEEERLERARARRRQLGMYSRQARAAKDIMVNAEERNALEDAMLVDLVEQQKLIADYVRQEYGIEFNPGKAAGNHEGQTGRGAR